MQDYIKRKEAGAVTLTKGGEPNTITIAVKNFDPQTGIELDPTIDTVNIEYAEMQQKNLVASIEAMQAQVEDGEAWITDAKALLKKK